MSQQGRKVKYPVYALESFYKVSKDYEVRLDYLLRDHYTGSIKFSEEQKSTILDTYLSARATISAVESTNLLEQAAGKEVIEIDPITAKILSELLMTLSTYQKKLSSYNINIDLH